MTSRAPSKRSSGPKDNRTPRKRQRQPTTEKRGEDGEAEGLAQALASLAQTVERTQRTVSASDNAAITISEYGDVFGKQNLAMLTQALTGSMQAVVGGDLSECEKMLYGQAAALQAIFTNLALQATAQNNVGHYEMYLRLAFKAQSQCRATIETLAAIKNPPNVAFVKQANIGQAVQVNNGHAREVENPPNKLLEAGYGDGLEFGTTASPIGTNPEREAVGVIDGPAYSRRKGARVA